MFRTLQGSEIHFPVFEKEATTEVIKCCPGQRNVGPDTFTRAFCSNISAAPCNLEGLHNKLYHPGVTRLLHFVRTKNLPYCTTDVKRVVSSCKICAEVKPKFSQGKQGTLIKAMKPMERLSIYYKGPIPSNTRNKYLLVIIDEYSRFPFVFSCRDMTTSTVVECLDKLFTLCGTPGFIHSDNGPAFISHEFTSYLLQRGISSSKSSIYRPSGNGQAKRTVQMVWKSNELALKDAGLSIKHWETVLPGALPCMRSLLCTAANVSPHERFFNFQRRSCSGESFPPWMTNPCKQAGIRILCF